MTRTLNGMKTMAATRFAAPMATAHSLAPLARKNCGGYNGTKKHNRCILRCQHPSLQIIAGGMVIDNQRAEKEREDPWQNQKPEQAHSATKLRLFGEQSDGDKHEHTPDDEQPKQYHGLFARLSRPPHVRSCIRCATWQALSRFMS